MEDNFEEFKNNHNVKTLPQVKTKQVIVVMISCRELVKPVFDKLLHKITKIVTRISIKL